MSESRRDVGRAAAALLLSAATHLSLTLLGDTPVAGRVTAVGSPRAGDSDIVEVGIDLPGLSHGGGFDPAVDLGGEGLPRPDGERVGLGGTGEVSAPAVNLFRMVSASVPMHSLPC